MPGEIGDIGFTIIPHPRDADTAWVFPMDGTEVWPRTSPGGRPAVYRTRDAGANWERQDAGFPGEQGWFTVKRQAFCADANDPVGLYLGTTGGELWMSDDEGGSFRRRSLRQFVLQHLGDLRSLAPWLRLVIGSAGVRTGSPGIALPLALMEMETGQRREELEPPGWLLRLFQT